MIKSVFQRGLFDDQTILVTGGGTGIGLRTARELATLGATVVLAGRRGDVVEAAAARIREEGGRAAAFACNIRDDESIDALMKAIEGSVGPLTALVNNAGGQFPTPAEAVSRKGWDAVIETNLTGPFRVAQAVFNTFLKARGGAIVSVLANMRNGFPTLAHTGAARAGVDNLTKSLAWEWGKHGVRLNAVAPGVIHSSGLDSYAPEVKSRLLEYGKFNASARLGTEAEVAGAIVYLLTPAARYVSGVTLYVDAGESLFNAFATPSTHEPWPRWD